MATVLVVDDNKMDRKLAEAALSTHGGIQFLFATDGVEALAMLEQWPADIVITDMQMPNMDGLTLVSEMRAKHPSVPVLLMTGMGSEDVASEALRLGAASYVPKNVMVRDLAQTVDRLLQITGKDRVHPRALQGLREAVSAYEIENDEAMIRPVVSSIQQQLRRLMICDDTVLTQVGVAIDEAMANAMIHGNLEVQSSMREEGADGPMRYAEEIRKRREQSPYAERRVRVTAKIGFDRAEVCIADDGPGFDHAAAPDPTDATQLDKASGRGVYLMRNFMDEVTFNDAGNEVTMIKRRGSEADEGEESW